MLSRAGAALKSALRPRKPPQASGSGSTAHPPGSSHHHRHSGAATLNAITTTSTTKTKSKSLSSDSTRTFLWRLLDQVLVPEARTVLVLRYHLPHPSHLSKLIARGLSRAIHATTNSAFITTPSRGITHSQSLFLPSRVALRQPYIHHSQQPRAFGAPQYLPRGPHTTNNLPRGPRAIVNVGLGTARNFSSGRPIFQNLVQNVPIVARALNEAGDSIDDVKRKITMMKRATIATTNGSSNAQNRSTTMMAPNYGSLRAQDGKMADRYWEGATHESSMPVSSSYPFGILIDNADRQNSVNEHANDQQKATVGAARPAVNHETVKSNRHFSDRSRKVSNAYPGSEQDDMNVTNFDHYFATRAFSNPSTGHHYEFETWKRCPSMSSTNNQSRPGNPTSRGSGGEVAVGRNFTPNDPFVTILSIPLAPPAHLIPPRRPLPSHISHSFDYYQEFGRHEVGSLHDAYMEHASRVTNLFAILDEHDVWTRGVTCDAFSVASRVTPLARNSVQDGMPVRVLRVKFEGWSEERVRKLLPPKRATGTASEDLHVLEWCEISSEPRHHEEIAEQELGMTFIMPTLGFSSAFSETAAASLEQQQSHQHSHFLQQPDPAMVASPILSPWSSSYCPTPSRNSASDNLDFDAMLSEVDITNSPPGSDHWGEFEFLSDRISSSGTMDDDAFEASDEMDLKDSNDDDAGDSEFWFPSSSSSSFSFASVSSSRCARGLTADKSFVLDDATAVAAPPMTGSRIAFSASFAERMA